MTTPPLGWIQDEARVAEVIHERRERGDNVYASAYGANVDTQLVGTWERMKARGVTGIFLRDRELVAVGHYRRPFLQRRGTCVSRGMCRGVQTSLDVAIADNLELLRPTEVSFAPIYSMARHEVGKDRCGSGDGAILADAAQAVHDYGVADAAIFGSTSEDEIERLAVKYAAPGVGTPREWLAACTGHTAVTFAPDSLSLLFDCIAAGYAVPYAHSYVTGMPNSKGISDLGSFGPHARCFTGVYVDENGDTQLVSSESWGRFPAGQSSDADQTMPIEQMPRIQIIYAGGPKRLAPGDVGVYAKRFWNEIENGGECWAVGAPSFKASSLTEVRSPYMGNKV